MDVKPIIICLNSQLYPLKRFMAVRNVTNIQVYSIQDVKHLGLSQFIDDACQAIRDGILSSAVGTSDFPSALAAYINQLAGLDNSVLAVLFVQNKYLSRQVQKRVIPEATPDFALAHDVLANHSLMSFPLFAKPTVSSISYGAGKVNSLVELECLIDDNSQGLVRFNSFYGELLSLVSTSFPDIDTYNKFMCEEIIPDGDQITVDGYVLHGNVVVLGATKSIFYEDIPSFKQFDYPYVCSQSVQAKINQVVDQLVKGLELNNMSFNIEMVVHSKEKRVTIVELNPRLSIQFAYLYEKVFGLSTIEIACLVTAGKTPKPSQVKKCYPCCSSLVLRCFKNQRVVKLPSNDEIERIRQQEGEFEIYFLVREGQNLSDIKQDNYSFRYGFIDIPGESFPEINQKFDRIREKLKINLVDSEKISDIA